MATPRTKTLKLYISSGITTEARANLEIIDALGAIYFIDSTSSTVIKSKEKMTFRPRDPSIGGSGVGGVIDFGTVNQLCSEFNVFADIAAFSKTIRIQSSGQAGSLDVNYVASVAGSKSLALDLSVDSTLKLGGNLSTDGSVSILGSGIYTIPNGTQTIITSAAIQVLTNKSIDGALNTITNIAAGHLAPNANIPYSQLVLTDKIINADIATAAAISYGKLSLTSSITNEDISSISPITYAKLALTNSIGNSDIKYNAAIVYSKLNLTDTIKNSDINSNASISWSKLASGAPSQVVVTDGLGLLVGVPALPREQGGTGISSSAIFPATGVIVTDTSNSILTNKLISGATNTFTDVPYASLNLTGLIQDADISSGAAIDYSKLSLVDKLVNTDISNSAAISGSKVVPSFGSQWMQSYNGTEFVEGGLYTRLRAAYTGQTANLTFALPSSDGGNGQVLSTNGSGQLVWTSVSVSTLGFQEVTIGDISGQKINVDTASVGDVLANSTTGLAIKNGVVTTTQIAASANIKFTQMEASTASVVPVFSAAGILTPSSVSTIELGYLSGVTSGIQSQINGLQAAGNYITSITGDVSATGPGSVAATIAASTVTGKVLTGFSLGGNTAIISTDSILAALGKTQGQINSVKSVFTETLNPTGFASKSEVIMTYDPTTRTVTITPSSASFTVYVQGVRYSYSTPQILVHANVTAKYFVVVDAAGVFGISTTPFDLITTAAVAYIEYNTSATPKGYCLDELHGINMDSATHLELHERIGTYIVSGLLLDSASFLVAPGTPTNAGNRVGILTGVVADEDNRTNLAALPDNGPYTLLSKAGVSGGFIWTSGSLDIAYVNSGTDSIQYNQFTGTTWQLTDIANGNFGNFYLFCIPVISTGTSAQFRYVWIPGQASFSSIANARLENVLGLDLTGLPATEIVPRYKVTARRGNAYTTTGRWRIEEVTLLTGSAASLVSISGSSNLDHRSLSFRDAADQHPTSAISFPAQSPAVPLSLDKILDRIWSSGSIDAITVTKNGDGTISLPAASVALRSSNSLTAPISLFQVPAVAALSLVNNSVNFVYATYNAGSPVYGTTLDITTVQGRDNTLLAIATRIGTSVDVLALSLLQTDSMASNAKRLFNVYGSQHASGAILGSSARFISITAGSFYIISNLFLTPSFDTQVSSSFTSVYRDGLGGWTRTAAQTQINNTSWDAGTGTLAGATTGYYLVQWIYIVADAPSRLVALVGQSEYSSIEAARLSQIPAVLPPEIAQYSTGILVGRTIVQAGAGVLEVSSPFSPNFITLSSIQPASKYVLPFVPADWAGPVSGQYSLLILASTHGKGATPAVQIHSLTAGVYESVSVDSISISVEGNITLKIPASSDYRFTGRVMIF